MCIFIVLSMLLLWVVLCDRYSPVSKRDELEHKLKRSTQIHSANSRPVSAGTRSALFTRQAPPSLNSLCSQHEELPSFLKQWAANHCNFILLHFYCFVCLQRQTKIFDAPTKEYSQSSANTLLIFIDRKNNVLINTYNNKYKRTKIILTILTMISRWNV